MVAYKKFPDFRGIFLYFIKKCIKKRIIFLIQTNRTTKEN